MESNCVKFVKVLMPGTIGVLSDSKAHVRQAATDTLNAWLEQTGLTCFVEGELLSTALATDNPYLRADLYKWLSEKLPEAGKLPSELSAVVAPVFASLEDRSPDVRKAAQLVLPPLTQHIGYDTMIKQTGKLKPASKQVVVGLLEKHKPTASPPKSKVAPSKPAASKQPPSEATESTTTAPPAATAGKKGKASAKSKANSDHSKSAGAADDLEGGAPLVMSNKNQRAKDDQNLKMLKWNFASPRGEHVDQLKEQFVPCANAMLRSQLFHSDFKYHLVALSTLTKCIEEHNSEIVANMDLVLR